MMARGSEWRRWDLHVHTPDTALNDQFGEWDEYLKAIEDNSDVKVLGVTDYLTITNYSRLKQFKKDGRIRNIDLLIPNIEFRIAPQSEKATAVNIHLLISPDNPNHESEILDALGRLKWTYEDKNYSCLPRQLTNFGKACNNAIMDDRKAFEEGVEKFRVDFTILKNWFESESWIRDNSLVAVAAGDDGLSGFRREGAWVAFRDEITRFSEILFSGRPGEREFWLGKCEQEDIETMRRLGGPKPCVHGSDAHSIAELFKPVENRYCWIKADPTFEGLRQILYEPEDRVHIGPTPPIYHDKSRVIRSVRLSSAGGWLGDIEIPLNAGLVSIIGQKGSGKSALAELIAYATGSWYADESNSFLHRADKYVRDTQINVEWGDGVKDSVTLWNNHGGEKKVRYLSQRFVERLCSEDKLGDGLIQEIESVVFYHLDPSDKMNASNFKELRTILTKGIREERQRFRDEINNLIREEFALRDNAAKLGIKENRVKELSEEREGLQKQIPTAISPEEAKIVEELRVNREDLNKIQKEVAQDKYKIQKINDIRKRIEAVKERMNQLYEELKAQLGEVDMPGADIEAFRPGFSGDTESPLSRLEAALRKQISNRVGDDAENPTEGTIHWFNMKIKKLETWQTVDKARQQRIKNIQTRVATINSEIDRINLETSRISGPEKKRIKEARKERHATYVKYFSNLKREQETLEKLYAPITHKLQLETASEHEKQLEFSIRWIVDVESWIKRGMDLFDQRRSIPYGSMEGVTKAAQDILVPAWVSGDSTEVGLALDKFIDEFRKEEYGSPRKYLRSDATFVDLLQWIYGVEHVSLIYGLKYNGVDLEKLSPGTKGIVLLILYLGIDTSDTRPLIVDQPDENLDNESIFQLLAGYFRTAKQRRQIILITHNPNLVVNTDSEQVIVASAEHRGHGLPNIQYFSGSLENTCSDGNGIRQRACRILEGGEEAFVKRERRYALRYNTIP